MLHRLVIEMFCFLWSIFHFCQINFVCIDVAICDSVHDMSRVMRKPGFCSNREADQHLCFRYMDSTIPLLPKSEILSL